MYGRVYEGEMSDFPQEILGLKRKLYDKEVEVKTPGWPTCIKYCFPSLLFKKKNIFSVAFII